MEQARLEICKVHRRWTRRRSSTPEYTTLILAMPELQSPTNSHDIEYMCMVLHSGLDGILL